VEQVTSDDGVEIAYDVWGRRDGPPVLLIQGLGTDSRGWALQRMAFGRHYR
jgi:pimeloyl-ACP methyl ester carboxylesterase